MSSVLNAVEGIPIKVQRLFMEPESNLYRAYPDNEHFCDCLGKIFSLEEKEREEIGKKTHRLCKNRYDWDKSADIWMNIIDGVELAKWDSPTRLLFPKIDELKTEEISRLPNDKFVKWCIVNILRMPDLLNSYYCLRFIRDLDYGSCPSYKCGPYENENSLLYSQNQFIKINRNTIVNNLIYRVNKINFWEKERDKKFNDK
jgi:hypothetical protein